MATYQIQEKKDDGSFSPVGRTYPNAHKARTMAATVYRFALGGRIMDLEKGEQLPFSEESADIPPGLVTKAVKGSSAPPASELEELRGEHERLRERQQTTANALASAQSKIDQLEREKETLAEELRAALGQG